MGDTKIQWTDKSWNPTVGCSMARGSETGGCLNCYAARMATRGLWPGERLARMTTSGPRWTGKVELRPERLDAPMHWRKPRRVFVNSMSDLFHEKLADEAIDRVFALMMLAPRHTFQILTKRPARMRDYFAAPDLYDRVLRWANVIRAERPKDHLGWIGVSNPATFPARWIWLGVSCEDQATADERIPLLLQTPAAVRFVSLEPLLGPIDIRPWLPFTDPTYPHGLLGTGHPNDNLSWVIVGGESGPRARPCDVAWIRSIVCQCREAGVACFVKQMGANVRTRNDSLSTEHEPDVPTDWPEPETGWRYGPRGNVEENLDGYWDGYQGAPVSIRLESPKGGDPAEWPEDLRVREFPRG